MGPELAEAFPLDSAVAVQRLRELGLVVKHRTGRLTFRTGLMRDEVAGSLSPRVAAAPSPGRARVLPRRAAHRSRKTPHLAMHAALAGEKGLAAETYHTIAENGRARHRYVDAELNFSKALELIAPDDVRARFAALKGRGVMRYRSGRCGNGHFHAARRARGGPR